MRGDTLEWLGGWGERQLGGTEWPGWGSCYEDEDSDEDDGDSAV